jgi:hypothetical protein
VRDAPHRLTLIPWLLVLAGCKPSDDFFKRAFACDSSNVRPQCGTTSDGKQLFCFGAKQLGAGQDMCVEPCSGPAVEGGDSICMVGKALLRTCDPTVKTAEDPDGCGPDLACLRTDLTSNRGVCLALPVCTADTDCRDPTVSTCATSFIKKGLPDANLQLTNLQCVISGCKARQTSCNVGQTCLPTVSPDTTAVPDICVPECDANLNCPPNYACWRKVSGPRSPKVCLPTLVGMRCTSAIDCMVGDCIDSTIGFKVCAVPCSSTQDCVAFSDSAHKQFCVSPRGDDQKYCMGFGPYAGALCLEDNDCPASEKCYHSSPSRPGNSLSGECRLPCTPNGSCETPRGGYPFGCLVRPDSTSCYPGILGMHCRRNEECLAGNSCEVVPLDQRYSVPGDWAKAAMGKTTAQICTRACQGDDDCRDLWKQQEAFCETGWCRRGGVAGAPCTRDQQCGRGKCQLGDGGPMGACLAPTSASERVP